MVQKVTEIANKSLYLFIPTYCVWQFSPQIIAYCYEPILTEFSLKLIDYKDKFKLFQAQ